MRGTLEVLTGAAFMLGGLYLALKSSLFAFTGLVYGDTWLLAAGGWLTAMYVLIKCEFVRWDVEELKEKVKRLTDAADR